MPPPDDPAAQQATVLLFGGANHDINCHLQGPVIPRDSNPGRIHQAPGGVARNVAENLAHLGHRVRLFSAVGEDDAGRQLLQATREAGVDTRGCWTLPGESTATYVALHGPKGELSIAINAMQVLDQLTPQRLAERRHLMNDGHVLVVDANLSPESLAWVFQLDVPAAVFADTVSAAKCRRLRPWLERVHTLKLNRQEMQALSGRPVQSGRDLSAATQWLHGCGVAQVVLSLGPDGLCWSERSGPHGRLPALATPVCHASGGGDALLAGLVHGHLHGMPLQEAAQFASACAAFTMRTPGATHAALSVAAAEQLRHNTWPTPPGIAP